MTWRRFDTLFVRLFLLMWVTLVASHLVAFSAAAPNHGPPRAMPPLPSLPPAGLLEPGRAPPPRVPFDELRDAPPPPRPAMPAGALWADYTIRALVIALGAALGARWLARPMKQLSSAAASLSDDLAHGRAAPRLDEAQGTREVREAAQVFNTMATRLQQQFDARSLQMAALSHDLRTPLTRLRLRLERLGLDEPQAEAAAADLHEMDTMVDDTLALMREQRDAEPPRRLDAAALLQAVADDRAEQGQDVRIDGALPPLRVRARPVALRRVLGNLLDNALRYGERARIGAVARGDTLEIHVDDDGPGLPPQRIAQAFEPWVRLPGDAARPVYGQTHGHGLGLAIARDLAERDGGRLTLVNRPEGGLRALLVLPAA
ncbi:ATP-binding protein [Piscinibacter sp.]|uniref:ATP-binding protein n=1 Tax=Piscinibacter sp. TaxID=1903157 RepID=UPI0039E50F6A